MRMFNKLKEMWPLVLRKTYRAEQDRHRKAAALQEKAYEKARDEFKAKWQPLMLRMMDITANKNTTLDRFVVHVELDRNMMECAARLGDKRYWEYVAKMASVHFERELATMNFAGLYKLAIEYEERMYRLPRTMPL